MVIITYTYTGTSFNAWAVDSLGTGLGVKQIDNWTHTFGNVPEGYVALGRGMQNTGHPFNGKIGEVLAYTEALSESDLTTIVAGLMTKWSTTAAAAAAPAPAQMIVDPTSTSGGCCMADQLVTNTITAPQAASQAHAPSH